MDRKTKKIFYTIIALISLSMPVAGATSNVAFASHGFTQAQTEKLGYFGPAKLTKTIRCYRIIHHYHAGRSRIIRKGARVHVGGGVGHWDWIVTYHGRRYFYLKGSRSLRRPRTAIGWFREI